MGLFRSSAHFNRERVKIKLQDDCRWGDWREEQQARVKIPAYDGMRDQDYGEMWCAAVRKAAVEQGLIVPGGLDGSYRDSSYDKAVSMQNSFEITQTTERDRLAERQREGDESFDIAALTQATKNEE